MGNQGPELPAEEPVSSSLRGTFRVTYHSHSDTAGLLSVLRLFQQEPYPYIKMIEIMVQQDQCCDKTILKVVSPKHQLTLQNILSIRRTNKRPFMEEQVWYIAKTLVSTLSFLQSEGLAYGSFHPCMLSVAKGRYLMAEILHLLPGNQHTRIFNFHNYYSPEALGSFNSDPGVSLKTDPYRSEVYSLGLLLLEIATCPSARPKFYKLGFRELLYSKVNHRLELVKQRYSGRLCQLFQMSLRPDPRTRPDWAYLKVWLGKQEHTVEIAPCLYWS